MSMYRQLWLAIIVSTTLALVGSLLASLLSARGYLETQLSVKNTDNAAALALSLSQTNADPVMVELAVASLFDSGHYEHIVVTDPLGKTMVERVAPEPKLDAPAWFVRMLPLRAQPGHAKISSGWQQLGTVTLASHARFAYAALWKSAYEVAFSLAAAGLVGGYLGSLVLRRLRRPLQSVIEQSAAITERRFVTMPEPSVPELRQMTSAMNAMVGRLKSMFEDEAARLEAVRREANFDPLTGLANRSYFMARLGHALEAEESTGGALVLVRLTDLEGINRRKGRAATDQLLNRVAETIAHSATEFGGGSAARLNGADFALILPAPVDAEGCSKSMLAQLIAAAAPFMDSGPTVSIGYGQFLPGMVLNDVLAGVDAALAQAESVGEDQVREAVMTTRDELPRTAEQWSAMIKRAMENNWLRLVSFPVIESSGQLSHRECPLRLMADEQGQWLAAGRFWPFAERLRLTPALDLAAVALGLRELESQPGLRGLAINLSASSLDEAGFGQRLMTMLGTHRAVTSRLWLEVTESGALKHLDQFRSLCRDLKSLGCRVGLEHFGHQFSQIGQLHELGLDYLKVDASFVRGIDSHAGNAAFLKGLTGIAHNIGLQVLAEGVATEAELAALVALGFDGATGPAVREVSGI